jgi:invasion protein IalB
MSVFTRLAGAALLCVLVSIAGIGISLGASDAKTVEPTTRQTGASRSGPAPPEAVPAKWRVQCKSGADDCQAYQSVYRKATGERLISVVVQIHRESREPIMRILLPLGIEIGYGASVQIGHAPAAILLLRSCNQNGCFAEYAISQNEIAALIKGERVRVSVRDRHRTMVRYRVSGAGFAEAYAKIK